METQHNETYGINKSSIKKEIYSNQSLNLKIAPKIKKKSNLRMPFKELEGQEQIKSRSDRQNK